MCDNSHLSFEFITKKPDGLLLYNGPIVPPEADEIMVSGELQRTIISWKDISSQSIILWTILCFMNDDVSFIYRFYIRRA